MPRPWLLIDTNYLCHRAYHVFHSLIYGDIATGVLFGVMRDVVSLQDMFDTDRVVFCFDHGRPFRSDLFPAYKQNRYTKEMDEEKLQDLGELKRQINLLRKSFLREAGFTNVLSKAGFEADDIIASVCHQTFDANQSAVIISADKDLLQLLSLNVSMFNPGSSKTYTVDSFHEQWELDPGQWVKVKAIAGCSTDNIPGVPGVGEITAAKYLRGELPLAAKAFVKIRASKPLIHRNTQLVKLPYVGCPTFSLSENQVTVDKWRTVTEAYGMHSLRNDAPISKSAIRRRLQK